MTSRPAVEAVTFGCRLNGVESERMVTLAAVGGHADLAIVNTCAVTAEAVRQGRQAIRRLNRERPNRPVVVTGCAATIDPAAFMAMPEVARLVPNADKTRPATWGAPDLPPAAPALPAGRPTTRGFVEVQNGCDHRCTFCVIPFGRGDSRSIPRDTVLSRARALQDRGVQEIVLTGVDITAYGRDGGDSSSLGELVTTLLRALPGLARLRVSSIDCVEADAALLRAVAEEPRLMPHWHLSLQSGADLVLKRMKRRHSRAEAVRFCAELRAARPEVALGADLIVGFPTETEAMFADTLALVEDCGLSHLHVFPFSPRPGTPAARMPAVAAEVVRERAARLRTAGARALHRHLAAQVGLTLPVLAERGDKGRTPDFSLVRLPPGTTPGAIRPIHLWDHDGTALFGRPDDINKAEPSLGLQGARTPQAAI